jgi:O-antigen/teichoic acid export membrane protein
MLIQAIVWGRSEVWFLNRFWPPAEVSFYSLGFNFTDKINMIPIAVAGAVSASLMVEFGRSPQAAGQLAITSLRYLALLALPLLAGLAALGWPLIVTLYGSRFLPAVAPLVLQCILLMPRSLLQPATDLLTAADRQRELVRWGLVMCVVNLGLDWWWIRSGGAMGAAWANGVAQILATSIIWALALRAYNLRFPFARVLRVVLASGGMGISVWGLTRSLPPLFALLAGVPAGAVIYIALLRLLRALDSDDRWRLSTLERALPRQLRPAYHSLLGKLIA